MNFKDAFLDFIRTGRHRRQECEPGPIAEAPALHEDDLRFILSEHVLRNYGEREYIGPGAAEAEARRTARLNPDLKESAQVKVEKPKRRRLSKAERLQRKLEKLRAEVEKLEKAAK